MFELFLQCLDLGNLPVDLANPCIQLRLHLIEHCVLLAVLVWVGGAQLVDCEFVGLVLLLAGLKLFLQLLNLRLLPFDEFSHLRVVDSEHRAATIIFVILRSGQVIGLVVGGHVGEHFLDLLHLLLESLQIGRVRGCRPGRRGRLVQDVLRPLVQQLAVLLLSCRNLHTLLGDLILQELNPRILRTAHACKPLLVHLETQLIHLTFQCSFTVALYFKITFELVDLGLQGSLLTVQTFHFLGQLLLVRTRDVKTLDSLLNVSNAPLFLLLEHASLLLVLLLALFPVSLERVLVLLLDLQLRQLKLALFVFAGQGDLLLLAFEFGFVLLGQGPLVLGQLFLALLLETVFFTPEDFVLFPRVVSELPLYIGIELVLEFLHVVAEQTAGVLGLHFDLLFHLSELLLVLAFFLLFHLSQLSVQLLLELLFLRLELPVHLATHLVKLLVKLGLDPAFFDFEPLDVDLLAVKHLVLLVLELLKFEREPLLLGLLDGLADAFVAGDKLPLFLLEFLLKVTLVVADALLCLHLNSFNLLFLLELELVLERLQLGIGRRLSLRSDLLLLVGLVGFPLLPLLLDLPLVLLDEFLLAEFEVALDLVVTLLVLLVDLHFALLELLLGLRFDQRVIELGAKSRREPT